MLILQVGVFCCITHFNLYRKVVTRPPSGGISLRFQTRLNLNPFLLLLVESPLLRLHVGLVCSSTCSTEQH